MKRLIYFALLAGIVICISNCLDQDTTNSEKTKHNGGLSTEEE